MEREPQHPTFGNEALAEDEPAASLVLRVGAVVGGGVLAAAVSSLPAALRIGGAGSVVRALQHWLALAALLTPVAVIVVAVLHRGRTGLRLLAGERAPVFAAGALWWAVLELGVLSIFGAVLRAKTHHHGLAGVTFAIVALVSGLVVAMLAVRGVRLLLRLPPGGHRAALVVAAVAAFVVVGLIGIRMSRAEGMHTAGALVDTLVLVGSAALASSRHASKWRPLAIAGVPVAALLLLLGIALMRVEPGLRQLVADGAPLQAWLLGLFGLLGP